MINTWSEFFEIEKAKDYYSALQGKVAEDAKIHTVVPCNTDIYNAFKATPLEHIKVVIVGQDCYINEGEAMGLAFSVPAGIKIPPSLRNIFKEIDLNFPEPKLPHTSGDLTPWTAQGVFLLNSSLTTRLHESNAHANFGWNSLTDEAIRVISTQDRPIVYMLWGSFAKAKAKFIDNSKHLILQSAHCSPLSAYNGFFGQNHFAKANRFLTENGTSAIDWST